MLIGLYPPYGPPTPPSGSELAFFKSPFCPGLPITNHSFIQIFNNFRDIFSALSNGSMCILLQDLLVETVQKKFPEVDAMVGLESRGFLFSFSIAASLGVGSIHVRKKGKLPGEVIAHEYKLEYGTVSYQSNY